MRFGKVWWLALIAVCAMGRAEARCTDDDFINPIDDIVWDCIFPISIMGIPIDFGNHPPDNQNSGMFCECPGQGIYGFGFLVGFWEPARMVDTVKDAWCFPGLGMDMDMDDVGWGYNGGGSYSHKSTRNIAFQHFHWYVMPVWAILDMFTDIPCVSDETTFDLAVVSEVMPQWADDFTAEEYYPETSLMANAYTVLACIADAAASAVQRPIDLLYWCMGSWGTTYPMTGHITAKDYVAANAGIAAKAMYANARIGQLPDRAVDYCGASYMPMWVKSHWRIQEVDPVTDNRCHLIGHPGIIWTHRKNRAVGGDNFSWVVFRKVECCVVIF